MEATNDKDIIEQQAEKISASGVLGRSRSYNRLFDYLVKNSLAGRQVKEIEIATEVFAKDANFDPSQDSMVRVYAHNLRQKLKQFYDGQGADEPVQLLVPRGEYRLAIEPAPASVHHPAGSSAGPRRWPQLVGISSLLFVAGLLVGTMLGGGPTASPYQAVAESVLWRDIMDDELPVLVVVGDYYIFAELDQTGNVARFVREFSINSPEDLDEFLLRRPDQADRFQDLNVTYLAQSTASALRDVFRVLYSDGKDVDVASMSELNPADLRTHHVVYVGYFSALDKLFDFVFAASSLAIGETFDQLWNIDTGTVYTSEAGRPDDYRNYRDYGYFSTFPGPSGNQFVVIAGTRDEGVMHSAQLVTNPVYVPTTVQAIADYSGSPISEFEMLYEVSGFDRTSIDARLVHAAALDYRQIWRGDLLAPELD